jgi:hypothetical protein
LGDLVFNDHLDIGESVSVHGDELFKSLASGGTPGRAL